MDDKEFERLVGRVFENLGCCSVCVVGRTGDNGVDVICKGVNGERIAVQAKRWAGPVGSPDIQRLAGGMDFYDCTVGYVVTTSGFTRQAHQFVNGVRNKRIELMGRDWIEREVTRLTTAGVPRLVWKEYFARFQRSIDSQYAFLRSQIGLLRALACLATIVVFVASLLPRLQFDVGGNRPNRLAHESTTHTHQRAAEQLTDDFAGAQQAPEQAANGLFHESLAIETSKLDDARPQGSNTSVVKSQYIVYLKNGRTRQITNFQKDSRGYMCRNTLGVIFRLKTSDVERIEAMSSD